MSRKFALIFDGRGRTVRRKRVSRRPSTSYIGLGSNLGSRRKTLEKALLALALTPGISLGAVSSLYETEPVGGPRQRNYLNGVVELQTTHNPMRLWKILKCLERNFGRKKIIRWGPRVLDLDLLSYDQKIFESKQLVIPHPRFTERRFVMVPFTEIAPNFRHPISHLTNRELLRGLTLHGQRVTMLARWKNGRFYPFKRKRNRKSRSSR